MPPLTDLRDERWLGTVSPRPSSLPVRRRWRRPLHQCRPCRRCRFLDPLRRCRPCRRCSQTIQAARLKGAHTIITGVSDAVAETFVDLEIDWSDVETLGDLQTGLLVALDSLGITLQSEKKHLNLV